MTKEEQNKAESFLDAYLGGNRNVSTLTWNHWVECLHDYGSKLQSENERLKAEREWISVETKLPKEGQRVDVCVVDPINGNYRRTNVEYSHKYIIEYLHWMPIPELPQPPKQ